jgi:flagellar protein FliO/FliZ
MEYLGLAVRVAVSLACVLGLMWLFSRGLLRGGGGRLVTTSRVRVLSRQSLGKNASVAVVRVGERALVLGVGDGRVNLLSDMPVDEVVDPATGAEVREELDLVGALPAPRDAADKPSGPLAGSALSPATWSQALDALRDRTARR